MAFAGNRILMLLENNPYSQDIRVKREARTLTNAGYQVTVICPKPKKGESKFHQIVEGVHLYQFPAPPEGSGFIAYVWEYGYATLMMLLVSLVVLVREGFDVIHAHNPPDTMFVIAAVYKLLGKKFVFDHHDLSPEMYYARFGADAKKSIHWLLLLFEQCTFRLADHVIATNESYKTIAMERGKMAEEAVGIVRNGPDLERFRIVDPDPWLRQKATTILGYVGIMGPQDGIDYLLRSVHNLVYRLNRQDIFCIIMGKGADLVTLQEMATDLGLEEHVWFTGWIPDADLLRYLSTADICLDPDPSNPFNDRCTMIKMTEYMALGKPIVAYDLPEHRFSAGDAAIYAKGNDEMDFATKIAELMDDPERRTKMGRVGIERTTKMLAWSHQEQALLDVYAKVCRPAAIQPSNVIVE